MQLFDKVPKLTGYIIASSGYDLKPDASEYHKQYLPGPDTTVWFCKEDSRWYVILKQ